jgi:predicted lipid carrier protein YhbT
MASARISGPLLTLLALFDGRGDADGAFFQRRIDVDGDTAAILALHNALEASELTMADILGLPRRLDPLLQTALSVVGRWRQGEVRP